MGQLKSKHKINQNYDIEIDNDFELETFNDIESKYLYFIDLKTYPKLVTLIQQIKYFQNGFDNCNLEYIYVHWNVKFYIILHSKLIKNSTPYSIIPINTHIQSMEYYYSILIYLIINVYNYCDEFQNKIIKSNTHDVFYEILVKNINSKLNNHRIILKIIDLLELKIIYIDVIDTKVEFMIYNDYSFVFLNSYLISGFIENKSINLMNRILKYCNLYINTENLLF